MVAAERPALQRRAVEIGKAAGTKLLPKMHTISLSEARPLQAPVGPPNRGRSTFKMAGYLPGRVSITSLEAGCLDFGNMLSP